MGCRQRHRRVQPPRPRLWPARSPTTGAPTTSTTSRPSWPRTCTRRWPPCATPPGRLQRGARRLLGGHRLRGRAARGPGLATFSSAHGVSVPETKMVVKAIPEHLDPPLHREYKRLINAYFTPAVVGRLRGSRPGRSSPGSSTSSSRPGRCDFMADFARPFPGLAFFELVLDAPPDDVAEINEMATSRLGADQPRPRPRRVAGRCTPGSPSSSRPAAASRPGATWSTPCWRPRSRAGPSPRTRSSASSSCSSWAGSRRRPGRSASS